MLLAEHGLNENGVIVFPVLRHGAQPMSFSDLRGQGSPAGGTREFLGGNPNGKYT